jgi:hypothetical protein
MTRIDTRDNYAKLIVYATCETCRKMMKVLYKYSGTDWQQEGNTQ